jgi:hypothetical protein
VDLSKEVFFISRFIFHTVSIHSGFSREELLERMVELSLYTEENLK